MLLGQELKFKNKLCNLKLGTFFSAFPGLGASALSGRVELACCPLPFPSAGDRWFRAGGAYKRNLNEIIKDKTIYE